MKPRRDNGPWVIYVCDKCGRWESRHFGYSHALGDLRVCVHEPRRVEVVPAEPTDKEKP